MTSLTDGFSTQLGLFKAVLIMFFMQRLNEGKAVNSWADKTHSLSVKEKAFQGFQELTDLVYCTLLMYCLIRCLCIAMKRFIRHSFLVIKKISVSFFYHISMVLHLSKLCLYSLSVSSKALRTLRVIDMTSEKEEKRNIGCRCRSWRLNSRDPAWVAGVSMWLDPGKAFGCCLGLPTECQRGTFLIVSSGRPQQLH